MADKLLSEAEVVARLSARLKHEPDILDVRPGRKGGLEVDSRIGGVERSFGVGIENLYRMYLLAPDKLDEFIEMLVEQVRGLPDQMQSQQRGAPNRDLFPQIKDAAFMRDAAKQGIRLAQRPFTTDLTVVYVADSPQSMRFLTEADVTKNGWTVDQLHEVALENLARKASQTGFMMAGEPPRLLIISQSRDSYDAARILLPDLQEQIAAHVPGRLLFGIPNRDFLVMLGDEDPEFVREIAANVRNDYQGQPYPLSPKLYRVEDGVIHEYNI